MADLLQPELVPANLTVDHYDDIRLNSATGYITPKDIIAGHQAGDSGPEQDRKLEAATEQRKNRPAAGRLMDEMDSGWPTTRQLTRRSWG